jgi:DNA-binding NarL/FixJ family response regulator
MRVLKAGAAGYLTKEGAPQELCRAVRKVIGGGKYLTPGVAEQLAAEVQGGGPAGARGPFGPRVPGDAADGRGQSAQRDRRGTRFER